VPERVRAAEVVGALSLATDLGMGLPFVILDAGDRVGDSWRGRPTTTR
jgi:cation diffusion facilitator CzcD-associated flavoprotein CzcO